MSMPEIAVANDGVSVVIPVHNVAEKLDACVQAWLDTLNQLGREYELILVDDGSTDTTRINLDELAAKHPTIRLLKHLTKQGFGACLRTALPETKHPLFFYTAFDYPYTPSDITPFFERINVFDERINQKTALVAGCRAGVPVPGGWKAIGSTYRFFTNYALGIPIDPLAGWLGLREHVRSWRVWLVYGVPLTDPNCAFKLYRKAIFDKFPIQSNGDFVHAEIVAKCTFLTSIIDEVLLTPKPDPIPATDWSDSGEIFRNPKFFTPPIVGPESVPDTLQPTPQTS